jgi:hypothetical protein
MRSPRSSRPDGSRHSAEILPAAGTQRCDQRWEFPRNTVATRRACRRRAVAPCHGSLVPRPRTPPTAALPSLPGAVTPHGEHVCSQSCNLPVDLAHGPSRLPRSNRPPCAKSTQFAATLEVPFPSIATRSQTWRVQGTSRRLSALADCARKCVR